MNRWRLETVLNLLEPPTGKGLWFGGASPLGSIRGITPQTAAWKPSPDRHSIWELTLHIAYWKYAVRRLLDGSPKGGFPRSPANWPTVSNNIDEISWKQDRAVLREEHRMLVENVRSFDETRLDELAPGSDKWTFSDLMFGAATHDIYHVGQIQILKRLSPDFNPRKGKP